MGTAVGPALATRQADSVPAGTKTVRPSHQGAHGNQAVLRRLSATVPRIQAKLEIGSVDDPLEHEADRVADQVMRMPEGDIALGGGSVRVSRKCAACEEDDKKLRTKPIASGRAVPHEAPASVHDVLAARGRPLDSAARAFFEPRFGADFSDVRVHDNDRAARSARDVGAAAYAVGSDVVFGAGRYQPGTDHGRRLIAHELAHAIQQRGANPRLRRAPCRSAADCAAPTKGDPAKFSADADAKEAAADAAARAAPAGSPQAIKRARMGQRAVNFETLLTTHAIALKPTVDGFFVNPNLDPGTVAAQTTQCKFFPDHNPGASPSSAGTATVTSSDKFCVQVPAETEDIAKDLVSAGGSLSAAQSAKLADILATGVHEMQHATFDQQQVFPATRTIGPEADCNLDTKIGPSSVERLLSEVSAETAEFPVYFNNVASQPNPTAALFAEERNQATNSGESLQGAIRSMKCGCSCATTDKMVTQAVNITTTGWPAAQTLAFLQAMTRIIPSDWPAALQRK